VQPCVPSTSISSKRSSISSKPQINGLVLGKFHRKTSFFHVSTLTSTVSGRFSLHPVLRSDQSQLVSNLLAQTVSAISPRHKSLRVSSSPQPTAKHLTACWFQPIQWYVPFSSLEI
jgi:hypothetical protein